MWIAIVIIFHTHRSRIADQDLFGPRIAKVADYSKILRRTHLEITVLSSNEILSETDQQDLRELLGDAHKDVEALKSDITQLRDTIVELIDRHAHAADRVKRLEAIGFAPHKKLPQEVLSRIFR